MRRLLQNRTFITITCVVALIVIVELIGLGVLKLRENLTPTTFIAASIAITLGGILIAFRVDAARSKSQRR